MRDWFATLRKPRATWATWATGSLTPCDISLSGAPDDVAQTGNRWATEATRQPVDGSSPSSVAQVAHGLPSASASQATAEAEENCGFRGSVARVAQVAHENGAGSHKAHSDEWGAADWLAFFDERAGIGEHDAGLGRADAEARAFECCIVTWMNSNPPETADPDHCAHCGARMAETDALPFLTGNGGYIWMHDRCHAAWMARRRMEAAQALTTLGVSPPTQ